MKQDRELNFDRKERSMAWPRGQPWEEYRISREARGERRDSLKWKTSKIGEKTSPKPTFEVSLCLSLTLAINQ